MLERIINIINQLYLYLIASLIIILPFAVDESLMFPTISTKFLLAGYTLIIVILLFLLENILKRDHTPVRLTIIDIVLAIYILYVVGYNIINAEEFGVSDRFYELIGLSVFYLIIRRQKKNSYNILFLAFIISGVGQAIYGNLQLFSIFPSNNEAFKITGGFFNPGPYAGYLAVVFPIALIVYFYNKDFSFLSINGGFRKTSLGPLVEHPSIGWLLNLLKKVKITESQFFKYISIVAIISILLILPATRSRAAWLALIISSAFILADKYNVRRLLRTSLDTAFKKAALIVATVILVTVTFSGLYIMKKGSADGRLLIWKVTASMIKERPIFGFGYDRFQTHYLNFQAEYFNNEYNPSEAILADNSSRAFNEYLQIASELGVIGVLLVFAMVYLCLFNVQKGSKSKLSLTAKSTLLSLAIFAIFAYPNEVLPIKICIVVCIALSAVEQNNGSKSFVYYKKMVHPVAILGFIIAVFITSILFNNMKEQYDIRQKWYLAYTSCKTGACEASLPEYEQVFNSLKYNGDYLYLYGKACSMVDRHDEAIDILKRAAKLFPNSLAYTSLGESYNAVGQFDKAEQAYLRATQILPERFYPKYLLAKLYDKTGQRLKAIRIAKELLGKKVKVESLATEQIKLEMKTLLNK